MEATRHRNYIHMKVCPWSYSSIREKADLRQTHLIMFQVVSLGVGKQRY